MTYARFGAMMTVSVLVMYALMYFNTYAMDHVWFSQTRLWKVVMMGAAMAIIMLGFMRKMYPDRRMNAAIFAGSAVLLVVACWLLRSQETVGDMSYMKDMIPHQSVSILTSNNATIRDARVRKLADTIIATRKQEIAEMEALIAELRRHPVRSDAPKLSPGTGGNG